MTGSVCTSIFSSLWATFEQSPRGQNPSTAADKRQRSQPSELYLLLSFTVAGCEEYRRSEADGGRSGGQGREGGGGKTHSQTAPYHCFHLNRDRNESSLELKAFIRVTQRKYIRSRLLWVSDSPKR